MFIFVVCVGLGQASGLSSRMTHMLLSMSRVENHHLVSLAKKAQWSATNQVNKHINAETFMERQSLNKNCCKWILCTAPSLCELCPLLDKLRIWVALVIRGCEMLFRHSGLTLINVAIVN